MNFITTSNPVTPLIFLKSDPQPQIEFLPHPPSSGRRSPNGLSRNEPGHKARPSGKKALTFDL